MLGSTPHGPHAQLLSAEARLLRGANSEFLHAWPLLRRSPSPFSDEGIDNEGYGFCLLPCLSCSIRPTF